MAKISWLIAVLTGFVGASYLIGHSYHDWQKSPVLTTITTHPLDDLEFPAVTVCPPKGSNTALNYDLMQLNNSKDSLSEKKKMELKNVIWKSLVENPHRDFAKRMVAATGKANFRKTFEGHFSVAEPYGGSGEEFRVWDTNGTIESENFKGNYSKSAFKTDRDVHVVLELPEDIEQQVGSDGSLVIELVADIQQDERGIEYLQYSNGTTRYTFHWMVGEIDYYSEALEADAECQSQGGHLVPQYATSDDEKDQIIKQAQYSRPKRSYWGYAKGYGDYANDYAQTIRYSFWDASGYLLIATKDLEVMTLDLNMHIAYICRITRHHINGTMVKKIKFTKEQLASISDSSFEVWYRYEVVNPELQNSWKRKRMTGFRLTWFIQNGSNVSKAKEAKHVNQNLRKMVILAMEARKANISMADTILTTVIQKEIKLKENESLNGSCHCERISVSQQNYLFDIIDLNLNKTHDDSSEDLITEEDIATGLKMYYVIIFCNKESLELRRFLEIVVSTQSPRTLLLSIVITLQSERLSWRNKVFLGEIYQAFEKMFDLQLGKILIALSTPSQMTSVMDHDLPYLSTYEKPIKQCLTDGYCQEVRTLIGSLGKNPSKDLI